MATRGLAMVYKMDISPEIRSGFTHLKDSTVRSAVRQSVRAALRPAKKMLSRELMKLATRKPDKASGEKGNKYSTGASMRALGVKVRTGKSGRTYGIVSVNRKYSEQLLSQRSTRVFRDGSVISARQRSRSMGMAKTNRKGRTVYARGFAKPGQDVPNYAKRSMGRRSASGSVALKRWPNKYWHLSEYGFKRGNASFTGHRFVEKVYRATKSDAEAKFAQILNRAIKRYNQKHALGKNV